jgi:hypothetical protein
MRIPPILILAALLAGGAAAEPVEVTGLPVLALDGLFAAMTGPTTTTTLRFPRPGWVRGLRIHLSDASGASADGRGILCHAYLRDQISVIGRRLEGYGVRQTPFSLAADEGEAEVELPPGFGLAVDTEAAYEFQTTLQSNDLKNNGRYAVKADYDFVPAGGPESLKTLESFRVAIESGSRHMEWTLPPGKHDYEYEFGLPEDYDVHVIAFHLHRYVSGLELSEKETGRVLYRGDTTPLPTGFAKSPRYSSAEGIALRRGKRYVFRAKYDNWSGKPQNTMAIMWLYASKAAAPPKE